MLAWATPTSATYSPSTGAFTLSVLSPPSLVGTVVYVPTEFTPTIPYDPYLPAAVVTPNPADDPLACSPLLQPLSRQGVPVAGNILLIKRGICTFYNKVVNAQSLRPALIVLYDSNVMTLATMRTYWDGLYIMGGSGTTFPTAPAVSISLNDGTLWSSWLLNLSLSATGATNLTIRIDGTGNMTSGDRAALLGMLQALDFTAQSPSQLSAALYAQSRPWTLTELARTDVDLCVQPLAGLWCIHGRVVVMRWLSINPVGVCRPPSERSPSCATGSSRRAG